jgi:hypothetical protein
VTGIVDRNGMAFTPKAVVIFGTMTGKWSGTLNQEELDNFGIDDSVTHAGTCIESRWFSGDPWRGVCQSMSYSFMTASAIYSAGFRTQGYVSSFSLGGFTYTLDLNLDGGFTFGFVAVGGDTLKAKVVFYGHGIPGTADDGTTFTITGVGFQPAAGIFVHHVTANGPYNDSTGDALSIGVCDTALNQVAMCAGLLDTHLPASAYRSLHPGVVNLSNHNAVPQAVDVFAITSWNADGFTGKVPTGQPAGTGPGAAGLLLGGVTSLAGTFAQPASDGSQTLSMPGMFPAGILFGSIGATSTAGSTIALDESWAVGAYSGMGRSWAYWHGMLHTATESGSTGGGANWGAADALHIAVNNGPSSSTIIEVGTLSGTALLDGQFVGSWTKTDGTARQVLYFAFGAPSAPPPPRVTYKTRRLKRFALPWDEANRWKFISRLEFILQTGIGDATGSNPVLMVRLSPDGGMTWGNEIDLTVGQMGAFSTRAYVHRLGRARNPVIEVTMTDAANWQLVQALVDLDSGTS